MHITDEIEGQATQLLPAALRTRTYRPGDRLIGLCWERREPVILRGEEVRRMGDAPADADAPWHLAVPIFRPASLSSMRPGTEVIGVIAVYNRDPLWSFSARDVELLTLHADRVARAMRVAELARQSQGQVDLLSQLGAESSASQPQSVYTSVREALRRLIDAPSFAIVLAASPTDVTFELAERDNQPVAGGRFPMSALPPWWSRIQQRQTLCISAPEDRAAHPDLCRLGFGDDQPVQSILAAPLTYGAGLLGAIVAGSPRPDAYAPEHERLLATMARSAAVLIQNARLTSESSQYRARTYEKEQQLARLNNAILTLNASLDLDKTLDALVRHAKDLTEAGVCAVFLTESDHLVGRAASRNSQEPATRLDDVRIPTTWRDVGRMVIEEGQNVVLDGLDRDWQDDSEVGRLLKEEQVYSCLIVPIMHRETARGDMHESERRLGCLVVYTPGQRHHFWPDEITVLSALASQAGGAISNARLYQELQRAYEEQKELDRLKEDFILQVSHEFRTPVTAIDGYVTLISRHGHKLDQEKLSQFASEIRQSTNQLMGMVARLHDASLVSSSPLQVALEPLNARECAQRAVADLAPEAKMRVQNELDADLWAQADAERLKAVFSNLLSNAIKYSPAACRVTGQIVSRAALAAQGRPHAVAPGAAERWAVIGVVDSGEGIAPDDQAKLFQKFVRLSRSLTTAVRGTGLGLWICRQYLDAMGGDIWVESELGKGATFKFSLPLAAPPANTQH